MHTTHHQVRIDGYCDTKSYAIKAWFDLKKLWKTNSMRCNRINHSQQHHTSLHGGHVKSGDFDILSACYSGLINALHYYGIKLHHLGRTSYTATPRIVRN